MTAGTDGGGGGVDHVFLLIDEEKRNQPGRGFQKRKTQPLKNQLK